MKKNIIKYFDMMLLIIILIALTLSTMSSSSFKKTEIIISFIMIIYIAIKSIKKKKIIQSKLDFLVILLVTSTVFPIIANTYISLSASVNIALNYITMLWIYLLTKEVCKTNKINIEYIKNTLIFITIILIFIGIENISSNKIFDLLKISIVPNGEKRLVTFFGNSNVFSSLIMLSFFISINEMIKVKEPIKKAIYGTCNTICIVGIILTYSKLTFLIFPFMLLFYIIKEKKKSNKIYLIQNVIICLFFALLYTFAFQILLNHQYYIGIWIFTIIWAIFVMFLNTACLKISKYFENIKLKKFIIFFTIFVLLSTIWIVLELQKGKEFVVFYENTTSDYNSKIIKNIKPNQKYIFHFDMYAKVFSDENITDMFTIRIIQRGSKGLEEIISEKYTFDNFSGVKEIEIFTTSDTSEIKIEFTAKNKNVKKYWVLNQLLINDKEVILEYKHLPTKLIEKLKDINIQYKTAQIRFDFIKDGFKLISQNFILGIGGGGWFNKYGEVQEREYIAIDPHNYYIQIWIEFGIIGLISILTITYIVISLKYKDKEQNATFKGVQFAILSVLLRSTLDLDMYFLSMKLIFFLCLGILGNIVQKDEKRNEVFLPNFILLIFAIGTIILGLFPQIYEKEITAEKLEQMIVKVDKNSSEYKEYNRKLINQINEVLKYERSYSSTIQYERKKVEAYINSDEQNLNNILQNYYETMLLVKNKWLYNEEQIIEKSSSITTIISMIKEKNNLDYYSWMKKLAKINIDEFEETKSQLTKLLNEKYKNIKEEIQYLVLLKNYNYAIQIIENY